MIENMEYPEGATPLDPNEMGGLKFKHITTRGELDELEQANIRIRFAMARSAKGRCSFRQLRHRPS